MNVYLDSFRYILNDKHKECTLVINKVKSQIIVYFLHKFII